MKIMVKLTFALASVMLSFACSSTDKTDENYKESAEMIAPGSIRVQAKVLEINNDNPRYMTLKIDSVLERGRNFNGNVFKGDTVNAYFPQAFTKQQIKDNLDQPTKVKGLEVGFSFVTESNYKEFDNGYYLVVNTFKKINGEIK